MTHTACESFIRLKYNDDKDDTRYYTTQLIAWAVVAFSLGAISFTLCWCWRVLSPEEAKKALREYRMRNTGDLGQNPRLDTPSKNRSTIYPGVDENRRKRFDSDPTPFLV